jgi:hypothetical protein
MKKLFLLIIMLISLSMAGQVTYTENFDVNASWTGATPGTYGIHYYTNAADPVNDQFSTNNGLRELATTGAVHSAPYAWRIKDGGTTYYFRYECEETVTGFDVWVAIWDNTPVPTVHVKYSTNSGTSYTPIDTITGNEFGAFKTYQYYSYTLTTPISPETGQKVYIEFLTTAGERMEYDDFTLHYIPAIPINPTNFDAVPFSTNQNNLSWTLNGASDTVMVAHNTTNSFGTPGGVYAVGGSIDGGGTVLYYRTGTDTSHTALTPFTKYYYKIWSKGASGLYSSGIVDSSTTYKVEPSEYPTDFAVTATGITANNTWTDATGAPPPDGYLIKISNLDNITPPVDGTPVTNDRDVSDGTGAINVAFGTEIFTFFRLAQNTTYYFKIYPYTNSGSVIDYKTDGEAPAANATTQSIINTNDFETNTFGTWTTYNLASGKNWSVNTGTGAYSTTHYTNINGYQGSSIPDTLENDWLISPGMNLNSYSSEKIIFFTWWNFGSDPNELMLKYSTDYVNGDPSINCTWTEITFTKPTQAQTWLPSGFIDLSTIEGTNVHIAFHYLSTSGPRSWSVDEIEITGDGISDPSNFNATVISDSQIDLYWNKNNNSNDVMIAWNSVNEFGIPSGYIPANGTIDGGGTVLYRGQEEFFSHNELNQATTYYYKAWSVDASDRYSSGVIDNETTQFAEPENHPTIFTATVNSFNQITVSWTDADASSYLVKGSSVDFGSIVPPVDMVGQSDSLLVKNVNAGIHNAVFTGLTENTTYYFKIYPYNGSGTSSNYKTDGDVPQASATTTEFYIGLIITEVADPQTPAAAKFVEIMNTGTWTINFSTTTIYLSRQANASAWADVLLTGSVAPGETYVLSSDATSFSTSYGFSANLNNGNINGNGNDGYFLYYGANHITGLLLDAYGVINEDGLGKPWEYTDKKAVRKRNISTPNTTWTASEWVILPVFALAKDMTPNYHKGNVTWKGTTSTNWNAKDENWISIVNNPRGYIPDASCNVTIPLTSEPNFLPIVTEASAINELQIESGATVIVSGTGSLQVVGP